MPKKKQVVVIGKQKDYDEERWRQFIIALAYALHEQRQVKAEDERPETPREEDGC